MNKLQCKRIAARLAGGKPLAWRLDPDGRMEVITAGGRDLWFSADAVQKAADALSKNENHSIKNRKGG